MYQNWTEQERLTAIQAIANAALNQCLPEEPHPKAWEWIDAIQALTVQSAAWLNQQAEFVALVAKTGGNDADQS